MSNQFDSANYPTSEPGTLQAGDRWMWKRPDLTADYPPASYALTYSARLNGAGTTSISITAGETSGEYLVEVASTTTAGYVAGTYEWVAYITRTSDSQRIEVDRGTWTVKANTATATTDPRSWARKTVDAIETYLADSNNLTAANYSINGRSLSRIPLADLLKVRGELLAEIAREQKAADLAAGIGTNSKIRVRFIS